MMPEMNRGHLQHASDCEQRDCFVVQGKQQEKDHRRQGEAAGSLPLHHHVCILR